MKQAYILEDGQLTPAQASKERPFCGFYASVGGTDTMAGDLFSVLSGPVLVPAYDEKGKRLNVGADKAGKTYDEKTDEWNE